MDTPVDIAFECLPLRLVSRLDVPLDASPTYRTRYEKLQAALDSHGPERTYFLYNARCIFRFANSEIEGMARFKFEGLVRTDASDSLTELVELEVQLANETCDGIPAEVASWLAQRVSKSVAIEFDRFISAGQLASRADELGKVEKLSDLDCIAGLHV